MTAVLDFIDNVPPLTIQQWLVCVVPLLIGQAVILLPAGFWRRRK